MAQENQTPDMFDNYPQSPNPIWFVVVFVVFFSLLSMCSCVTSRVATDTDVQTRWHDSTRVQVVAVYDTTHVVDTTRIVITEQSTSSETADVVFGSGGGTYNTRTGEATNVVGVRTSAEVSELKQTNALLTHELTQARAATDSLAQRLTDYENHTTIDEDVVRTRSAWDTFCSVFTIAALLVGLLAVAIWAIRRFYLHI